MIDLNSEQKKRNTAYKLKIGDIKKGQPEIVDGKFIFLDVEGKKIVRVNVIANLIEKNIYEGDKKYGSGIIDDASGQIRIKFFGDDTEILKNFVEGDTLKIIGVLREYNKEIYISPEIIKKVDPKWLLARKLELQNERKNSAPSSIRDIILEKIKEAEKDNGIDAESLINEMDFQPKQINETIKKLIEEGMIYEPRPGRLRYLG